MWTEKELKWIEDHETLVEALKNTPSEIIMYFTKLLVGGSFDKVFLELGPKFFTKLLISLSYLNWGPGCIVLSLVKSEIWGVDLMAEYEILLIPADKLSVVIHKGKIHTAVEEGTDPHNIVREDALSWLEGLGIPMSFLKKVAK